MIISYSQSIIGYMIRYRQLLGACIIILIVMACGDPPYIPPVQEIYDVKCPEGYTNDDNEYEITITFSDNRSAYDSFYYYIVLISPATDEIIYIEDNYLHHATPFVNLSMILTVGIDEFIAPGYYDLWIYTCTNEDDIGNNIIYSRYEIRRVFLDWDINNDEECPAKSSMIAVYDDGYPVQEYSCVYITDEPQMPHITAIVNDGITTGEVIWMLEVKYTRSKRTNDDNVYSVQLPVYEYLDVGQLTESAFMGGEAIITAITSTPYRCRYTFEYSIRGTNAPEYYIEYYIDGLFGKWYCKFVAMYEGGSYNGRRYLQFNEVGELTCGDTIGIKYTPNWGDDGYGPGGFGLFQLTRFDYPERLPSISELWSWTENAQSGVMWLNAKQDQADDWMQDQRFQAFIQRGYEVPVPDRYVYPIWFKDNTDKIIEHAVALKAYNGADNGHYCYWDNESNAWGFHTTNSSEINYVARVCEMISD